MDKTTQQQQEETQQLPSGWTKTFSKSQNRYYYYCHKSKHTQWHFPTASEVADPLKAKQRLEQKASSTSTSTSSSSSSSNKRTSSAASSSSTSGGMAHQDAKRLRTSNDHAKSKPSSSSSSSSSTQAVTTKIPKSPNIMTPTTDKPCIAIIVPYRDIHKAQNRSKHLQQFIPQMQTFLNNLKQTNQIVDYHIYIIEQSNDKRKFNRGKLLNIGFHLATRTNTTTIQMRTKYHGAKEELETRKNILMKHNVFIFHDVDLIPAKDLSKAYATYPTKPIHIARVWDRYSNNTKYFGGIVSFSHEDMIKINGYPNTFWGWGGEDDEMQKRCEITNLKWTSPSSGTIYDLEHMDLKEKLQFLRENKEWKCMIKWEALAEHEHTWKTNGLKDLDYKLLHVTPLGGTMVGDGKLGKATKITVDVKLNPNHWANDKCGVDYMGS